MDEGNEHDIEFFKAREDTPKSLESTKQPFYVVASLIQGAVVLPRREPILPGRAPREQSSNAWDAHAAKAFGFRVVWCNRFGQAPERIPERPDGEIGTLSALPEIVGA